MEFNQTKQSVAEQTRTTNPEGGEAFVPATPERGLLTVTINNLLEDSFYQSDEESLRQVRSRYDAVADENPEFVLKLAAYAREEMGLRDISQLLLVLSAHDDRVKQYVREYAPAIMQRADEPATALAMNDELFGVTASKPLKKGINDALHQWDSYQFSKYAGERRQVNMKDVINRTHPKPQDEEHDEIFEQVMLGELDDYPDVEPLEPAETWETTISERGNTAEAWEDVLPKMGLFGILRNLRNMLQAGVHEATILGELDLEGVRQSKLFPFRFYQAHKALQDARLNAPRLEEWLSDAIDISAENLPDRLSSTMVAVDLSGSMDDRLSERSDMTRREIGSLFGAILANKGAIASGFGSDFDLPENVANESTLEIMQRIERLQVGHSTNGWKAIKFLREGGLGCDRIVMFTDEQIWDSESRPSRGGTIFSQRQEEEQESHTVREEFKAYRDEVAPECSLYIINLASYGTLSTPEGMDGVFRIGGWSSQVLDFVEYAEKEDEIIDVIENYEVERDIPA